MVQTIWDMLGISPTDDKRAIKKAYSIKCSTCHPEEQPEAFDHLHKAYLAALKAASGRAEKDISASGASASGSSVPGSFVSNSFVPVIIAPISLKTIQTACNLSPIYIPHFSYIPEKPQSIAENQGSHHRFGGTVIMALMVIIIVIAAITLISITTSKSALTNDQVRSIEQYYLQSLQQTNLINPLFY